MFHLKGNDYDDQKDNQEEDFAQSEEEDSEGDCLRCPREEDRYCPVKEGQCSDQENALDSCVECPHMKAYSPGFHPASEIEFTNSKEVSNMITKTCTDCGQKFQVPKNEAWKQRCLACFIKMKQREEQDTSEVPV